MVSSNGLSCYSFQCIGIYSKLYNLPEVIKCLQVHTFAKIYIQNSGVSQNFVL